MEIIEYIEISFRTTISNLIAIKYGSIGHENKDNFRIEKFHTSFMEELQSCIYKIGSLLLRIIVKTIKVSIRFG